MKQTDKLLKTKFRNNRGSAMVFVILIFAIVTIFTMSLITVSNFSVKSSIITQNQNRAYYLARAGAEAIRKAWESTENPKPTGDAETIYVIENYDFKLEGDLTPVDKVIGIINVKINPNIDDIEGTGIGTWEIISIAEINGSKGEARLTSAGVTSIKDLNEEYDDGDKNRIINMDTGELLIGSEYRVEGSKKTIFNRYAYPYNHITRHNEIRGTLVLDLEPGFVPSDTKPMRTKPIKFIKGSTGDESNANRHIGITAESMYFESPIDLRLTGDPGFFSNKPREGALIASGKTIVFKNKIDVKYNEDTHWLFAYPDYGYLILDLPDGLGFSKPDIEGNVMVPDDIDPNERYGSVYFLEEVKGHNNSHVKVNELGKKGFYFSKSSAPIIIGDPRSQVGIDKLIPMKINELDADTFENSIPSPDTNPIFFWK